MPVNGAMVGRVPLRAGAIERHDDQQQADNRYRDVEFSCHDKPPPASPDIGMVRQIRGDFNSIRGLSASAWRDHSARGRRELGDCPAPRHAPQLDDQYPQASKQQPDQLQACHTFTQEQDRQDRYPNHHCSGDNT